MAAIERGSTNVALARAPSVVATSVPKSSIVKEEESAQASIVTEQWEKKRWSNAPILPELDFGSSSSGTDQLFDLETLKQRPKATISVSILVDNPTNFNNSNATSDSPSKLTYRCDIHAKDSASHNSVEKECQDLVKSVGGHLLNSYFCPGGFLYTLPLGTPEPITACDIPLLEAKIGVEAWTAFSEPQFNGLRLHPPEGRLGGDRPARSSTNEILEVLKAREKTCHGRSMHGSRVRAAQRGKDRRMETVEQKSTATQSKIVQHTSRPNSTIRLLRVPLRERLHYSKVWSCFDVSVAQHVPLRMIRHHQRPHRVRKVKVRTGLQWS